MEKIVCVAGPTASGKTKLAVELAKAYDGEVLSCDSMQIYRGMAIGTAAPTLEEMQGVVHHMIGVADPGEDFSVGKYVELAEPVLQDILSRGKTCVVCGGTGLYADSLLLGRSFAPCPSTGMRETLEAEARQSGIEPLLARLKEVDPEAGARLHPSDKRRIIRALEVYLATMPSASSPGCAATSRFIGFCSRASRILQPFSGRRARIFLFSRKKNGTIWVSKNKKGAPMLPKKKETYLCNVPKLIRMYFSIRRAESARR